MLLSLNWLKEFVDFNISYEELENILTMLGIEVESVEFQEKKFEKFIVAEVLEKEKHPNADKLSVCKVNTGDEIIQVVCGAPNVDKGQKVILGLSGAVVPNGKFMLERRKIRGIESNGMICSLNELELGDSGDGIEILKDDAPIGEKVSDYFGLNDTILEISLTPNKSDCLSHLGIARELAAYFRTKVKYPDTNLVENDENINDIAKVIVEDLEKCPRYTARVVKNCKISKSPEWLEKRLQNIGLRSINVAVDVTNLVLMESGQPLHAFDFDKIKNHKIVVKTALEGEKLVTLDGKERILSGDMLLICDDEKPIAIGGVMGGENSEIDENTTNILIESAFFDPSSIRKTSKKLGLQSDSSYRFERGVDISNVPIALDRAAKLIAELTGGEVVGGKIDVYPNPKPKKQITLRYNRVNKILGTNLKPNQIDEFLTSLMFELSNKNEEQVEVIVPYHRVDIDLEIDLIEEIARLNNYDNIENSFNSNINFASSDVANHLKVPKLRNKFRNWFVYNGFNEILTQNQIDPKSAALFTDNPIKIANPLGEELSVMRPSMIPSLLNVISKNIRNFNLNLKLFEIGKVFLNNSTAREFIEGIEETEYLTFAISGNIQPKQWGIPDKKFDFFDLKGIFETLINEFNIKNIKFSKLDSKNIIFSNEVLQIESDTEIIGIMGKINDNIMKIYDIEQDIYLLTVKTKALYFNYNDKIKYEPISPYPKVTRDLAFLVDKSIDSALIADVIKKNAGKYARNITLFDVYEGKNIPDGTKSLAYSIEFVSNEKTLTDEEIDKFIDNIIKNVESSFKAQLRK